MARSVVWCCVVAACAWCAAGEWYDTFTGNQITEARVAALRLNNLIPVCAIEVKNCSLVEPRRFDYSCNNLQLQATTTRGAIFTPFHRLLPPDFSTGGGLRTTKAGTPLPNARALRVALVPDGRIPSKKNTHMLTTLTTALAGTH
ncbi:hypothetical protein evm_014237 [Chilo suppressalis]|nr:hypothetical protein evm_014237 [Chilo suppressalis]